MGYHGDPRFEALLLSLEDLSPSNPPEAGSLLVSKRKYQNPLKALLQERNGVWYIKDLTETDSVWLPKEHYVSWRMIWKKYAPLSLIRLSDVPTESLEEYLDAISWMPKDDI